MTQARGPLSVIHNIISVDGGTHFEWYKLTEMVVRCRVRNVNRSSLGYPDPLEKERRVWAIGWGGSVPCGMYGISNNYNVLDNQ